MRLILCLLVSGLLAAPAYSQFETNYTPMVSQGALPADFVTLSSQKYQAEKSNLKKNEKKEDRKSTEKFLLQSSFALDEMLLSGKVLFNDSMAAYINQVADKAFVSEPETRAQLRFYVLKSTSVNAFATHEGVIFVTTGLLAQIENEAELAFVLCHEAVHFKEKHSIQGYLESDKIEKGKGAYKHLNFDEQIISRCAFSKDQEKEADEKGLEIFLKSKYSTAHLLGVYDVLKYAYLPFDDITFDKSFLENATMKFPDDYYKVNTQPVDTKDIDDDDSRSTHPSIKSRREVSRLKIKDADNGGKSDYLVGEQAFTKAREIARFELCRLYTLHHRYEAGIYTSYMLLKKYPNNLYLKKNVGYCLAGLAQYSNERDFDDVHYDSDSIEGKSQALFYLMFRLDSVRYDLNIVALAYAAKLKKEYPLDSEVGELYKNLMHSLVADANKTLTDFSTKPYVPPTPETEAAKMKEEGAKADTTPVEVEKSKYDKLREQETTDKTEGRKDEQTHFTRYAFVDLLKEDWFREDFEKAEKNKDKDKIYAVDVDNDTGKKKGKNDVYGLGIKKVVAVDPYYARINANKREKYKYLESEGGQVDFTERLKDNAKAAKLDMEVLSTKDLKAGETDKMTEISILKDYISERLGHTRGVKMPYAERKRLAEIAGKHGTDFFMWTGVISLKDKNLNRGWLGLFMIYPLAWPFILPELINGNNRVYYFTLVVNIRTDETKMALFREVQDRSRPDVLDAHIYDVLHQIKSSK